MSDKHGGDSPLIEGARFEARHPLRFRLVFDDGSTYSVGRVENLSTTGVFMEVGQPIPVGKVIRLEPLEHAEDALGGLFARVVRCDELDPTSTRAKDHDGAYGLGLELLGVDLDRKQAIREMISRLEAVGEKKGPRDPYLAEIE